MHARRLLLLRVARVSSFIVAHLVAVGRSAVALVPGGRGLQQRGGGSRGRSESARDQFTELPKLRRALLPAYVRIFRLALSNQRSITERPITAHGASERVPAAAVCVCTGAHWIVAWRWVGGSWRSSLKLGAGPLGVDRSAGRGGAHWERRRPEQLGIGLAC